MIKHYTSFDKTTGEVLYVYVMDDSMIQAQHAGSNRDFIEGHYPHAQFTIDPQTKKPVPKEAKNDQDAGTQGP